MDKDWVKHSRISQDYIDGAKKFVKAALQNSENQDSIICPCRLCQNQCYCSPNILYEHLVINGMDPTYTTWVFHGEKPSVSKQEKNVRESETFRMYRDACIEKENILEHDFEIRDENITSKMEDSECPLYEGCEKYTKLSAVVVLLKLKATHGLSDKCFDQLLETFKDMLPQNNTLPESLHLAKKLLKVFDLGYEKMDACINDCCLFRKDLEHHDTCPKCGASRWKVNARTNHIRRGVPVKVLRYFLIIPRFKRMFKSVEMSKDLTWHHTHKSQDQKMRHPVDSLAWDTIDSSWPSFATDPRNLRLGLATDGFNPFSNLSSRYSCWPVILVTYNLPPWKCMSKENLMLTLLIPGPKQLGHDIDVYLQLPIEDLNILWDKGVDVHDALSNSMFNLKALLMWTINDFPAYGNLSGWPTKGKFACPVCGENTCSLRLPHSKKHVYMSHRRFLPATHYFRKKKHWFDGKDESRGKPRILTGEEVFAACKEVENDWGKKGRKRKKNATKTWKKKSIFFDLPYWEKLCLRHNLDVMHIEKNICESIVGTLLDLSGKTKDGLNSRKDLQELGIRHELHIEERGNKSYLPPAPCTLSKAKKQIFCKRLFNLRLPDGYSSNISNCIVLQECKILGLKSHDCHVLMQQLLAVAIRGILPKGPRKAIFKICAFFNELCQRVIDRGMMESLQDEIMETLCLLERYFPPSFFDIMVHLVVHLAREARLCGPVQYRWMYPFERFMKVLKGNVRNRARPEGCIAECYLAEECTKFCSQYVKEAAHIGDYFNRNHNFVHQTIVDGSPKKKGKSITLPSDMLKIAHRYILFNSAEIEPYIEMHLEELRNSNSSLKNNPNLLHKTQTSTFSDWLYEKVIAQSINFNDSNTLKWLALGPAPEVVSYSTYLVNGTRYHTFDSDSSTQDSGVSLEAKTICRASARDNTQIVKIVSYYGVIKAIYLINYLAFQVPLFKCTWANSTHGVKLEDGFTLVNLHQHLNLFDRDPFILATQAKQVFYSRESDNSNWYVVLRAPPRGFHDLERFEENAYRKNLPLDVSKLSSNMVDEDEDYVRSDCEGILV